MHGEHQSLGFIICVWVDFLFFFTFRFLKIIIVLTHSHLTSDRRYQYVTSSSVTHFTTSLIAPNPTPSHSIALDQRLSLSVWPCVCLGHCSTFPDPRVCVCDVNALQLFAVTIQLKLLLTAQRPSFIHLHSLIILFTHSIIHGSSILYAHACTHAHKCCVHAPWKGLCCHVSRALTALHLCNVFMDTWSKDNRTVLSH